MKRGELDALVGSCDQRGVALISDEVFSDYAFAPDPERVASLASRRCPAYSMSGLSKVAGLPQMKLGWIVAARATAHARNWNGSPILTFL